MGISFIISDVSRGSMEDELNDRLSSPPGEHETCMGTNRLTCSSFTIMKHRSLSNPFRPKVPSVVWISEKRRLLVTSWWVFISYQVFSWSMWHVILKEKQNTPQTQKQLRILHQEMWGSIGFGVSAIKNSHMICVEWPLYLGTQNISGVTLDEPGR